MAEITTSTGTTISLVRDGAMTLVVLDHPDAPAEVRHTEAGRVIDGGFQPAMFCAFALSAETLRALADLLDTINAGQETHA